MKLPLANQTILNTRPAETAQQLSDLLKEQGADVLECPMLVFKPPPTWQDCDNFYQKLTPKNWVVFTSANAIKRLAQRLNEQAQPLNKLKHSPLAAIGASTAKALLVHGWQACLTPHISQQENLLAQLLKVLSPATTIWIPRALQARSVLEDGLQKAGHQVKIVPVYQALPPKGGLAKAEPAIMEEKLAWLTFTSPQAISNFIDALSSSARHALQSCNPRTACIGSITSEIARLHGLRVVAQPSQQNIQALVKAMIKAMFKDGLKTG